MQAQGGPSRAELWDKGQQGSPDSYPGLKTSSKSKTKSLSLCCSEEAVSLLCQNLVKFVFLVSLFVEAGGGENEVIVTESKWEKKPTSEMYTNQKNKKYTVYPTAH